MGDEYLRLFVEETALYNRIVLGNLLPFGLWVQLPHYLQTWLRNYIADSIPSRKAMLLQIYVAMKAMPWELHDIKFLYKHLHATHHIYNKQNTLSPFAGLAFHPLDGILQAVPHVIALYIVPAHFTTHMGLLFLEAIWTTNIHDCIHVKLWPVMGAGYHTIHHTTYRHNYGHYTIWMDWMLGTLRDPSDDAWGKLM
ncbi:hypothetical protein LWI28_011694 [Acer negundo]|uniref:Fatty acid hydroxylase domain-containing protein n=1 Tax=Acer negundo TaxID=4023 RepID=A0AAD5IDE1_ACENE|nr:hypothetical protein LWI28_011694 [Acer negundo]